MAWAQLVAEEILLSTDHRASVRSGRSVGDRREVHRDERSAVRRSAADTLGQVNRWNDSALVLEFHPKEEHRSREGKRPEELGFRLLDEHPSNLVCRVEIIESTGWWFHTLEQLNLEMSPWKSEPISSR